MSVAWLLTMQQPVSVCSTTCTKHICRGVATNRCYVYARPRAYFQVSQQTIMDQQAVPRTIDFEATTDDAETTAIVIDAECI